MNSLAYPYGFGITLHAPHAEALAATRDALAAEGLSIVTEFDVATSLRTKLGAEHAPYVILGVCSAPLALKALHADPNVGVLLPCTVAVYELDRDRTTVAALDPKAVLSLARAIDLHDVGSEAAATLRRALRRLEPLEARYPHPVGVPEVLDEIC